MIFLFWIDFIKVIGFLSSEGPLIFCLIHLFSFSFNGFSSISFEPDTRVTAKGNRLRKSMRSTFDFTLNFKCVQENRAILSIFKNERT